jgi:hypothetical protein
VVLLSDPNEDKCVADLSESLRYQFNESPFTRSGVVTSGHICSAETRVKADKHTL